MNKFLRINYSLYIGVFLVSVILFLSIFGPIIAPHSLTETFETYYSKGKVFAPPLEPFKTKDYPLGTDRWGYDLASMVLNGIRYTIFVAIAITIIKILVGTIIGIYMGTLKKTPSVVEAFENAWSYVPVFIILYFFLRPISFNSGLQPVTLAIYFIVITALISVPSIISSIRKKTQEVHKSVFIEASKTLGAGRHRIVWRHIFPQMKESIMIMFVIEIVHSITIMGQLALMNIFIGGTIMRTDPVFYISITKELSGLVGAARGNIYSTIHVLTVPLIALLITTLAFSLLANGLKNRYQSNYQRTPWIRTGFEPTLVPVRKQFNGQKWWTLKGENLAFAILLISFVGAGSYLYATKDDDIGVKNYSQAEYELSLKMDKNGTFHTKAEMDVENLSMQAWDELVFYFIPNVFQKGHRFEGIKGESEVKIKSVKVDGEKVHFELQNDSLKISLKDKMEKRDNSSVEVDYSFTVPEGGSRFSKVGNEYYLAQWYPMLATFKDGKWNKNDYMEGLETFDTGFADYKVNYKIPKGYSFVSTADQDAKLGKTEGIVEAKNVRDFFIAIVKDMDVLETKSKDVKIRLFARDNTIQDPKEALELAKKALTFYQDNIGEYPHEQLDIVLDQGQNMEYPGIVTVDPDHDQTAFFRTAVVHEIAHQYFYGVVANDSYNEAWLDEGFTEFATNMYFFIGEKQGMIRSQKLSMDRMSRIEAKGLGRSYSNRPLHEIKDVGYVYGQPALKLFTLIQDNYKVKGTDLEAVTMQYLSDYYHHFQHKEVDTNEFLKFTMDYFQVPKGYFTEWLDTSKG
ncbi:MULTISPECIES: ABC transporter permease subunit [unclassified Bacillus (in: firmicutes)]|uniref:ABC transporter permease subunit n=1 Tax=unclassified Bacillus (in: firmicutes) TaxID=185979 RepID=UPI0008E3562A|nr:MULTISPECIES: ABC transporter permease subunit [unclassified Bacillus (in: firmicutes)]SFA99001.1 ABC-type dipeptide/oligopeptide/nickel transport system, permease component [Bacillus sp. UNCCL13]SFQ81396.1 ABC-type dipeptide/oligopeptide/nickel transport system, permease component [Bacillus sp. cl95]